MSKFINLNIALVLYDEIGFILFIRLIIMLEIFLYFLNML
jgi:hypothetical protein